MHVMPRIARALHTRCAHDWSWDSGPLVDHDLWFVERGHGRIRCAAGDLTAEPGVAFLLRSGERYRAEHDPRRALVVTAVHFDWRDQRGRVVVPANRPPLRTAVPQPRLLHALLERLLATVDHDPAAANAFLAAALSELRLAAAAAAASPAEAAIDALCAEIRADPARRRPVAALAARCGWSRHHFARRFKARTGSSPRSFQLAARIAAAQDLLAASDLPIARVAEELAYPDVYAFSKQFASATGVPPSTWRRERRR